MPRKDVPYGGAGCCLMDRIEEVFDLVKKKLHSINGVQGDGRGDVKIISGDPAVVITSDAAQNEIEIALDSSELPGVRVSSVNGQTGAVRLDAADIPSDGNSNVQAAINKCSDSITSEQTARENADAALQGNIDAALPAATPQVYIATIPQTDYLDVCLAQYVRIGPDKGLLSLSGHMRNISLPGDVFTLISIDTVMSAMGLTHKRPSAYRTTGWWHYDDGDDDSDRYGSGTVCQVSPSGGLELGRYYSGTAIGNWDMQALGRDRYISVRDVYVEIQSDAQHAHALSAPAAVPGSQHSFRVHQSYL